MKDRAQFHFNYWMIAILVFLGLQYLLSAQQDLNYPLRHVPPATSRLCWESVEYLHRFPATICHRGR